MAILSKPGFPPWIRSLSNAVGGGAFRRLATPSGRPATLSPQQVIEGYRSILGRDPESEEVIRQHATLGTVDALRAALVASEEYRMKNAPGPMDVGPDGLDAFVAGADALGGAADPRAVAWWAPFRYRRKAAVAETLDPYSETYVAQQIALYREISGRDIDQRTNEAATFHLAEHVAAANPYAHQSPSAVGLHLSR